MTTASLEGKVLGNKYQVLEPLGRGGMAQVYRAYHKQLDRFVAIKVLRSDLVEDAEFLARFQREARAVAGLRHPNIVQVYDFDTQDGLYYMVMELLEGDTLKARLNTFRARGEHLPYAEMARILQDILAGLEYAHSEGLIHRDIKPANILLSRRDQAVLTDFGIAQIVGGTQYTVSGALMGTLQYMAPEQGLEGHTDPRSDLYSLGIVFFEMLTGRPPFDADTPLAILLKHVNDPLPVPHLLQPGIPPAFERVVLRSLAKRPEERYASAAEMIAAVQSAVIEALGEMPGQTVPAAQPQPTAHQLPAAPVFSGNERRNASASEGAADDTDAFLSQRLNQEETVARRVEQFVGKMLIGVEAGLSRAAGETPSGTLQPERVAQQVGTLVGRVMVDVQEGLASLTAEVKDSPAQDAPASTDSSELASHRQQSVARAALLGVVALVGYNILALAAGLITGWWDLFSIGWPVEILLAGLLLSLILRATRNIWLLIPGGIVTGVGVSLAFFSVTGLWRLAGLLVIFLPVLIFTSIALPVGLSRRPDAGQAAAGRFGNLLVLANTAGVLVTAGLVAPVSLLRQIFKAQ